jgi:hypothetical protein
MGYEAASSPTNFYKILNKLVKKYFNVPEQRREAKFWRPGGQRDMQQPVFARRSCPVSRHQEPL